MKFDKAVWTYEATTVVKDIQAKFVEDLPQQQRTKIQELRKRFEDELQPKHNDFFFVKWLKARKWDVSAAENMLRAHLRWRKEWRVDHMYEEFQPTEVMLTYLTLGISGEDKEGSPLYIMPVGNADVAGIMSSIDPNEIMKFFIYCFEYCNKLNLMMTEKHGKVVSKQPVIADMDNFRIKEWINKPVYELFLQFVAMFEGNYPEILKFLLVIKVSRFFRIFYSMVKPFLCEDTKNKIILFGKDQPWNDKILELVDSKQLPVHWGGEMVDEIDGNPYCSTKIVIGGKVPKSYYKCFNREKSTDNELHTITIGRRETFTLDIEVPKAGSTLSWSFWTEEHDIGFGVYRGTTTVMPNQRYNCALEPEKGEIKCKEPGNYSLVFDNSFSWYRAKEVSYEVQLTAEDIQQSLS